MPSKPTPKRELCARTLRHVARSLTALARAHLQSERNLHDIPEAVELHRTSRLAHEHAAEIFAGEADDVRNALKLKRIERKASKP